MDPEVIVRQGDLSAEFDEKMRQVGLSAWDLETDGLDFRTDKIRTCQVFVPGVGVEIVQVSGTEPRRLIDALASERVAKLFHHAMFDLRFMRFHWSVRARRVGCTKVMSKLVEPGRESHSLAPLVAEYLGIALDKGQQRSDWSLTDLTPEQITYAASDVVHLPDLFQSLWKEAINEGVADLVEQSFEYLPTRVESDLRDAGDVFAY